MKRIASVVLAAAIVGGSVVVAAAAGVEAICDLTLGGKSGLGPWTGRAPTLRIRPTPSSAAGRWNALLVIAVKDLENGNKVRDVAMHKMFESRTWPEIRAELRDVSAEDAAKSLRLPVALTVRDKTNIVEATLANWKTKEGHVEFEADVAVSLRDFSLDAPMVLGLTPVDDRVAIHARVVVDGLPAAK